jgi:precorrin-4 methylase
MIPNGNIWSINWRKVQELKQRNAIYEISPVSTILSSASVLTEPKTVNGYILHRP